MIDTERSERHRMYYCNNPHHPPMQSTNATLTAEVERLEGIVGRQVGPTFWEKIKADRATLTARVSELEAAGEALATAAHALEKGMNGDFDSEPRVFAVEVRDLRAALTAWALKKGES